MRDAHAEVIACEKCLLLSACNRQCLMKWHAIHSSPLPGVWISTSVAESRSILSPPFIVAFHFSHTSYQGHRSILFNTILYSHKFRSDRQTFDGAYKAAANGTNMAGIYEHGKMASIEWNLFVACHSATRKFTVTILCTRGRLRLCNALSSEIRIKKWKHNAQIFEEFHSEVVRVKGLTFYLPRLLHRSKYILFHSHSCMSWAGFTEFWFESANKLILWVFFNEIRYNLRSNRHVLNANRKFVRWQPFTQISLSICIV